MDELVIGDKKYISSKLAAKATGYAKDYVGQLCREGRVPARLVGRNWYVLESAIQDHRFGGQEEKPTVVSERNTRGKEEKWESPRYEAAETEVIPIINRLQEEPVSEAIGEENLKERLQETWQAWFDRFEHAVGAVGLNAPEDTNEETVVSESVQEEASREEIEDEPEPADVPVPIRAIHHVPYQPPPVGLLPKRFAAESPSKPIEEEHRKKKWGTREGGMLIGAIQIVGIFLALFAVAAAVLGSGYLDIYIVSNSTARIVAGVGLYNK